MHDKDRLLRTFLLVAHSGSLQRAAEKLGVTQPAISKQISNLEEFLGCNLFQRHGRGMTITQAGQRLAESTSEHFAMLDAALDSVRTSASAASYLRIVTVNTLAAYLIPPVLVALRRSHPQLLVRVDNASSPEVVDQVARGHADVGLVYDLAVNTDAVCIRRLYLEEVCAYESSGGEVHQWPEPRFITAEQLSQRPLIVPPRPYALRRVIERELPAPLNIAVECNSISVSLDLASAGVGTVILPSAIPDAVIIPRGLNKFSITGAELGRQVVAIHRPQTASRKAQAYALKEISAFAERVACRAQ
jgi:LysR family transcriptional regulator, nitrogen assimilation regulatory protein